jgi:hypothetical protein
MSEAFASVNGQRVTDLRVKVANTGPWTAECAFEGEPELSGRVTIQVGTLQLSGTIVPTASGTFSRQLRARIVAGAGGWGSEVPAKGYHNDAGVKARTVAEDAARATGESIGTFVPRAERVGRDYARQTGPASRALEDVLGGVAWWVDFEGVTHAGPRPTAQLDASAYEVLAYDPKERIATLAMDDPAAMSIGAVLSERLDAPQTVREYELRVTAGEFRVVAWCGGSESAPGRLAGLFRSIIERASDGHVWGLYRYRVVRMVADRVELQAVRKAAGLPDLLPVSMWPGIAGAHAELTPGAEVLVTFVEGDRTMPVVTHFAGKDGTGFVPVSLTLGGPTGAPAARQGDAVEVLLPPMVFSGTAVISGVPTPMSGVLTATMSKALGVITAGSAKVKVAS